MNISIDAYTAILANNNQLALTDPAAAHEQLRNLETHNLKQSPRYRRCGPDGAPEPCASVASAPQAEGATMVNLTRLPMPSPNGTNFANRYLPRNFGAPVHTSLAHDSATPCAHGECRCSVIYDAFDKAFDSEHFNTRNKQMSNISIKAIRRAVRAGAYASGYGMAYDAAEMPDDNEDETSNIDSICDFVSKNFSADGIAALISALGNLGDANDDEMSPRDTTNMSPRGTGNMSPRGTGNMSPRGTAQDSFNRRYPMAGRIGVDMYGVQPKPTAQHLAFDKSGDSFSSFAARYPDAARIVVS